jgi:signal transduction histidine kinase
MGTLVSSTTDDAALGTRRGESRRRAHVPKHSAGAERRGSETGEARREQQGLIGRMASTVRAFLPRGNTLDKETFERRHLFLSWVLALHVPGLFALGAWQGYDLWHVTLELTVPVACVGFGRLAINRRLASFFVTAGLVYCSVVLVHLSGGMIEAHFHFFILIGLIALYQDWVPFLWNVVFTVLSHGLGSAIGSDLMFEHGSGQSRPWTWAALHGLAVLAACVGEIIFWKHTEQEQHRNVELVADLAAADVARREAMSELLVNLARRNQSLLNRQLEVITDLELRERQPDVLEELFRLDHLATRIRRNAESLLVLSGDDPARRWGNPVPLGDVVRAAAAEVEDYRRVEVLVNDHIEVEGRAVADLAHLLAELIENATTFSPPSTDVRVRSHLSAGESITSVISIEDAGIGMSEDDLHAANALLAEAPEVDLGRSTMLGFHVVARLSQRYGLTVRLAPTPGGGVTAMVTLPADLISERPAGAATPAGVAGADRYHRAAAARSTSGSTSRRILPVRADERTAHLPAVEPAVPAEPLPSWRELPAASSVPPPPAPALPGPVFPAPTFPAPTFPAPTFPESLFPEPPAGGIPPFESATPWSAGPAPAAPVPAPPDWWWESEALLRRAEQAPDPPGAAPAGGPFPGPGQSAPASPAGNGNGSDPGPDQAPDTALAGLSDGLVRRVPGAHLAPALRRDGEADAPAAAPPPPALRPDREQVRSMLSRFQDSQRAGRAAADPAAEQSNQENR